MSKKIRVKFVCKAKATAPIDCWLRQFAGGKPVWGDCEFTFDCEARDYDWLVVYDELPHLPDDQRFSTRVERLPCPREHTLFITGEPSSIKIYGNAYLAQYGAVLSSQEEWAIRHPGVVRSQPALRWFYGMDLTEGPVFRSFDSIAAAGPTAKTGQIATVCSRKAQRHTLHHQRLEFTTRLKEALPELQVYGYGHQPIPDKADAIDPFRYHLAIENHFTDNHWTEKLADPFLGFALPIYYGCPNAESYFPEESLLRIDIFRLEWSVEVIRQAIRDDIFPKRLPAITEARRRVLHEYNTFAVVSRMIQERHQQGRASRGESIHSRHAMRRTHWHLSPQIAIERIRAALRLRRAKAKLQPPA